MIITQISFALSMYVCLLWVLPHAAVAVGRAPDLRFTGLGFEHWLAPPQICNLLFEHYTLPLPAELYGPIVIKSNTLQNVTKQRILAN